MGCTKAYVEWHGFEGTVTIDEPVLRYPDNPILTCHDVNEIWSNDIG
jgi:hypothetical protein